MTPFQWGLATGLPIGCVIGMLIMGILFIVSRPRHREIGRDEIARLKG